MARKKTEPLTAQKVERLAKAKNRGMHGDGGGLWLQITEGGASWVFRFMLNGRARSMGLGPLALFDLKEARAKALDARRLCYQGIDPIEQREAAKAQQRLDAAKAITFQQCADAYINAHRAGWRNGKHAAQWTATLATHAEAISALPVQTIDTALVLKVLEPIWTTKPETASRVRGRIERILDWAKVSGYRDGENPARWRGHLDHLLAARSKVRRVKHHAALPFAELPGFLVALREQEGISARALEFCVLTAARTGEVIGARWSEIDLIDKTWTVSAERMKPGREHRVPLPPRALAILQEMQAHRHGDDGFVFPGGKDGKPLSNMAFLMLLRRMDRSDLTAHGFRATFKTWATDRTGFQHEIVEASLAHVVGSKVEQAYQRSDHFEKRRRLMQQWATFCTTAPVEHDKVVSLQRR
jgi:integrase